MKDMTHEQKATITYYRRVHPNNKDLTEEDIVALQDSLENFFYFLDPSLELPEIPTLLQIQKNPSLAKLKSKYSHIVRKLSKAQNLALLPNSDKPRAISLLECLSPNFYVLDHKISIKEGFKNNIPIEYMASLENLQWIPGEANNLKGTKCTEELKEYFSKYSES